MNRLLPCPSCARHVRASESSCPFCQATLAPAAGPALRVPGPATRLGRAALFAFGTGAAAAALVACSDDDNTGGSSSGSSGTSSGSSGTSSGSSGAMVDAAYGGPPIDAGFDGDRAEPAYGGPPVDAGTD